MYTCSCGCILYDIGECDIYYCFGCKKVYFFEEILQMYRDISQNNQFLKKYLDDVGGQ